MDITTRSLAGTDQEELLNQVRADEKRIAAIKQLVAQSNDDNWRNPTPFPGFQNATS